MTTFPSSEELGVPNADWLRVGTALFGLYLVATGISGLLSAASLWLWISRVETLPNSFEPIVRSTHETVVKEGTLQFASIVVGLFLYYGKDKIRYFWNRSGSA